MEQRDQAIERILQLNEELIGNHLAPRIVEPEHGWLSLALTMTQFKTLLIVSGSRPLGATVGFIARKLGVGLPTASGILDRLHEQGLITRREDGEDRRVTRIAATEKGQSLVDELYSTGQAQWRDLLTRLDNAALQTVEQAFVLLAQAAHTQEEPVHKENS